MATKSKNLRLPADIAHGTLKEIIKASGRKYYRYSVMIGGKRIASEVMSRERAETALRQANATLLHSAWIPNDDERERWKRAKLRDWCEEVLDNHRVMRPGKLIQQTTVDLYRDALTKWVYKIDGLGGRRLDSIGENDMLRLSRLMSSGLDHYHRPIGFYAQRNVKEALSRVFRIAKKLKYVRENWAEYIEIGVAKPERSKRQFVTDQDTAAILSACQHGWLYGPLLLGALTGMRPAEVAGLRWEHVHLDAPSPYIEVVWQVRRVRRQGLVQKTLKTTNSYRPIWLDPMIVECVRKNPHNSIEYVFVSPRGNKLDTCEMGRKLKSLAQKLNITCRDGSPVVFTSLCRRGMATRRDRAELTAEQGANLAGHTEQMQLQVYQQDWREVEDRLRAQEAMAVMNANLKRAIESKANAQAS